MMVSAYYDVITLGYTLRILACYDIKNPTKNPIENAKRNVKTIAKNPIKTIQLLLYNWRVIGVLLVCP